MLLGMVLVAGCAAYPKLSGEQSAPVLRQEARLHLPADPASLDSAHAADPASLDLLGNLMEGLVRRGEDGAILPGVAESWESSDGSEFTFSLRRDARWSDGRTVTADDFVFAWLRALDPQNGSDYAFLLYDIEGAEAWNTLDPKDPDFPRQSAERIRQVKMTAVDPRTLQVTLRAPNPNWVSYTLHPIFFPQRATLVARVGKEYGTPGSFIGNGPFLLERWREGQEIILRKNPAYWDTRSVRLPKITFRIEPDGKAALRLYQMGELDQVVLPGELALAERGAQRITQPSTMGLVFNTSRPPFSNWHLRRAIHLAIDRKRLVEEVTRWSAIPSEGLIPPSLEGGWKPFGERIPPQGNQLQARQLWDIARKDLETSSVTVRLLHAEESTDPARALQAMLQENLAGLTVELEVVPFGKRLERVRLGEFDLVLQGWTADHDDPATLLALFVTDGPGNDARWKNPTYDDLLARVYLTGDHRAEVMSAAERVLLDDLPVLPLYHPVRYWMARPYLKGLQFAPGGARLDLKGSYIDR